MFIQLYILDNYPDQAERLFLIRELSRNKRPSHPLVTTSEFRASERVVLKILDVCQNQIEENLKDRNYRHETILNGHLLHLKHVHSRKMMQRIVLHDCPCLYPS